MFTGLVSGVGTIASVETREHVRRARIVCEYDLASISLGASIACAGPCLTVVDRGRGGEGTWFEVDIGAETLARTTASRWREGTKLNLERSLKVGDELGGHLVTGHIDGIATIDAITAFGDLRRFDVSVPPPLARFIAEKGSVALDGTSLTVNAIEKCTLSVLLIPHSLAVTTWSSRSAGDPLNLEVDLMARYAARLLET